MKKITMDDGQTEHMTYEVDDATWEIVKYLIRVEIEKRAKDYKKLKALRLNLSKGVLDTAYEKLRR